jgi:probable phosphoglycerate mutase
MSQTLYFVRHGRTRWNDEGRYLGRSEIDLDDVGRAQARQLADWAARTQTSRVVSSPALRAKSTASVIAERLSDAGATVEMTVDDRLREVDFGIAEGRTLCELRRADPQAASRFEADPAMFPWPGGEIGELAAARTSEAVADAVATGASCILVVTHNTLLRLYLCQVLGISLSNYRRHLPVVDQSGYTELRVSNGVYGLCRFNVPVGELAEDRRQ